jgi:hypothetical protein
MLGEVSGGKDTAQLERRSEAKRQHFGPHFDSRLALSLPVSQKFRAS